MVATVLVLVLAAGGTDDAIRVIRAQTQYAEAVREAAVKVVKGENAGRLTRGQREEVRDLVLRPAVQDVLSFERQSEVLLRLTELLKD